METTGLLARPRWREVARGRDEWTRTWRAKEGLTVKCLKQGDRVGPPLARFDRAPRF